MGRLMEYLESNKEGRIIQRWVHYFDIYERHLAKFVDKPVNVLEIGIYRGGSLPMWKHYFGEQATIYGMDINPGCKAFEEERVHVLIGDQGDPNFWRMIKPSLPTFDIIIDDGGHYMHQQILTFQELYSSMSPHGVYLVEDLHSSYMPEYGGALEKPDTFVEYSKKLIDQLHFFHEKFTPPPTEITKSTHSLHYYDSVLVVEKKPMNPPYARVIGEGQDYTVNGL
ncbi:cephalosporin hydroxylase [Croceifilum oryzae]|uniref:Cephalosporin hydroxylase n=1 Tax=Croceifilum oryzae TaxID=1553429 RepID=A0AAJ1WS04_9BACL|nr:hypothetical protein [Croceifilum oryzae]MDQ0416858.1 cephalosporin hydroxylase [Croceifilum oryzae]